MSTHATYALGQRSKGDAVRPVQASRREQPHVEHGKIVPAEFAQILGNEVAVSKRKLGDNAPHYAANTSPEATAQAMTQESRLPNTRQSTLPALPRQETPLAAPPASRQGAPRTKRPQESPRAARQGTPQTPRQTASRILQTPSSISGERLPSQEKSLRAPTTPLPDTRSAEPRGQVAETSPSAQEPAATYSAQVDATQEHPRSGRTVSYTHLTLPTKRIV